MVIVKFKLNWVAQHYTCFINPANLVSMQLIAKPRRHG
jgi:hypothetical protein